MSNILETVSLEPKESSTYPFFAETDLHLPCLGKGDLVHQRWPLLMHHQLSANEY